MIFTTYLIIEKLIAQAHITKESNVNIDFINLTSQNTDNKNEGEK